MRNREHQSWLLAEVRRRVRWVVWCVCPFLLCELVACGADFSMQGSAKMRMYMLSGAMQAQSTVWFTAHLRGCRWFIRLQTDEELTTGDYAEASFDGTNVYYLSCISNAVALTRAAGRETAPNIANAITYRGEVIHRPAADELSPIWLACASGCFFQSQTTNLVEPGMVSDGLGGMYGPPQHRRLRTEWAFSEACRNFPVHVVYFSDGNIQPRRGSSKPAKLPIPYDAGCTSAIYHVDAFTNVGSATVPLLSSLKIYTTKPKPASAQDLRVLIEYTINLTNWKEGTSSVAFQPQLPGPTVVNDERDHPQYYWATNGWPSIESLRNIPSYKRSTMGTPPLQRRAPLWAVRVVFALAVLVPGVYASQQLFRRRRKGPKRDNSQ